MTLDELEKLPTGSDLWLVTGTFTASRVRLVTIRGTGACRRPVVRAVDHAPGQAQEDFNVSARSLQPIA